MNFGQETGRSGNAPKDGTQGKINYSKQTNNVSFYTYKKYIEKYSSTTKKYFFDLKRFP